MKQRRQARLAVVAVWMLLACTPETGIPRDAQAANVQAGDAQETEQPVVLSPSQQQALDLLVGMVDHAVALDAFNVKLNAGFDVLQPDGEMIQFLEKRAITVVRPNAMRSEEEFADGVGNLVVFDGSRVTIFDPASGVYAQADTPDTLDEALIYFQRDLGMRLPLGGLFTTRILRDMFSRIHRIDYVERVEVGGVMTHHLAARVDTVDFQVWLAAGGAPLPRRIVLTYPEEGRPQFWAEFTDWNLRPDTSPEMFTFTPPAEARRVPFAVQMVEPAQQEGSP